MTRAQLAAAVARLSTQVDVLTDAGCFDEAQKLSAALMRLKRRAMNSNASRREHA